MNRRPFYTVGKETYLFPDAIPSSDDRKQPEEAVRQWCAFELMRAYGISINQLVFERKVCVGSKTYRIDILVLENDTPWAVIECKKPGHTKHGEAMEQAVSYANAEEIRADLAIYTNGLEWNVQQRIGGRWVSIPDIPRQSSQGAALPLVQLLRTQNAVAPLLHKMGDPLERDEARRFLGAMQCFFNGMSLLTVGSNRDLLAGTDNLLRVLSGIDHHPNYRLGKLAAAAKHYESFRGQAGYRKEIQPPAGTADISEELHHLHVALFDMIEGAERASVPDASLLRLNVALLEYGRAQCTSRSGYPVLGSTVHDSLRAYLSCSLAINLNASLPDPLDHISCQDLKDYCAPAWKQFGVDADAGLT